MSGPQLWSRPSLGAYYWVKKAIDGLSAGQFCVVSQIEDDWIHIEIGTNSGYRYRPEDFENYFEALPDGASVIQRQIEDHVTSLGQLDSDMANVRRSLAGIAAPHLDTSSGDIDEKSLVPVIQTIADTKACVSTARNDVALLKLNMKQQQAKVQQYLKLQQQRMAALFREQADALASKLGDLNEILKKAEEAIWTINLYLGKNETIVQIAKGAPAPKDTKISIRQLVLYADEECALDADAGGIDFRQLQLFDKWISMPRNRQQVLPEPKGVVALKVRRKPKKYDHGDDTDPMSLWQDAQANAANMKTYFFMANGENLYRICTDLEVGDHIIPTQHEHADLFFREEFDSKTRSYKKEPIYPGDAAYMEAMEQASTLKRHYLRILLFLQGLLDRTAVFAPLPAPRLNILNRAVHDDHLAFINDGENLLGTGRPSYTDWRRSINAKLDIGHRIIGCFSHTYGLRQYRKDHSYGNHRLNPTGASYPSDNTLYVIEGRQLSSGRRKEQWFFLYERTDTIYRKPDYRKGHYYTEGAPKRRASCLIEADDEFILNFDAARVEDMEFYLNDRTNRHTYEEMFPLLRRAIQIKHEEAAAEAPFRDLIAREVSKKYSITPAAAELRVDELITWWKLKNKTHRALLSDDQKALRMIVTEYGRRVTRDKHKIKDTRPLLDAIKQKHPTTIFVGHKKGDRYVAVIPHNAENIFATIEEWSATNERIEYIGSEAWQTISNKQALGWGAIYSTERWNDWQIDASPQEHLTDPEFEELAVKGLDVAKKRVSDSSEVSFFDLKDNDTPSPKTAHLAVITKEKGHLRFWIWTRPATVPKNLITGKWRQAEMQAVGIDWRKKDGALVPYHRWESSNTYHIWGGNEWQPWPTAHVFKTDEQVCDALRRHIAERDRASNIKERLNRIVHHVAAYATEAMKAATLAEKKAEFLAEYEHEELWEDHKKALTDSDLSPPYPNRVRSFMSHLVEKFYADTGMIPPLTAFELSFGALQAQAIASGWQPESEDDANSVPIAALVKFTAQEHKQHSTVILDDGSAPTHDEEDHDEEDHDEEDHDEEDHDEGDHDEGDHDEEDLDEL